jgi:hypothetical protein
MGIKSILTGKRGVSLPFSDHCEPVISHDRHFTELWNYIIDFGKRSGWKLIELRGKKPFLHDIVPSSYYYGHTLDLSLNEENVFSYFRDSTKRNIRKAIREQVKATICNSLDSVKEFYRLNCITRKHHALPPQPFHFFDRVHEHIICKNQGIVVLASYKHKVIASAVCFHFGKKAIYKYGASDRGYQHLRANNLVMWTAIRWYCQNGYNVFDMGRTEPKNNGLNQFKAGWGTQKQVIPYYKYNIAKQAFMTKNSDVSFFSEKLFHNIPIPLLRIIGILAYKHIG